MARTVIVEINSVHTEQHQNQIAIIMHIVVMVTRVNNVVDTTETVFIQVYIFVSRKNILFLHTHACYLAC